VVGLFDGEFKEVCGITDVVSGGILGVEQHHVNRDTLRFQGQALGFGKSSNLWLRGSCRRSAGGLALRRWGMVGRLLPRIDFRHAVDFATYMADHKHTALMAKKAGEM